MRMYVTEITPAEPVLPAMATDEERPARTEEVASNLLAAVKEKFPSLDPVFIHNFKVAKIQNRPCEKCTGLPCAKTHNSGWRDYVQLERGISAGGKLTPVVCVERCRIYQAAKRMAKFEETFNKSRIPLKYIGETFEDYQVTVHNENAVNWAHYIITEPNPKKKGLYLYGDSGRGKTFLTSIIAQELIQTYRTVIFGDVPSLLEDIRATYNDKNEKQVEDVMNLLTNADVLVLDDIGTENLTSWAIERLYLIINGRYNANKGIILTSNYRLDELEYRYGLADTKIGERIVSRLKEMCAVARIGGEDWRDKK